MIKDFRVSSGAAGPKVARSRANEEKLIGKNISEIEGLKADILDTHDTVISPHAMPEWRRNTTRRMLDHFLSEVASGAPAGIIE